MRHSKLKKKSTKDIICGFGEIGKPIFQLVSKVTPTIVFDINPKLMDKKNSQKYDLLKTRFLHICIPFSENFISDVLKIHKKYQSEGIIIHSTISPGTTKKLQKKLPIPIIYSAVRGVHRRMFSDLKRYTKFFSIEPNAPRPKWASSNFQKLMKNCKVKTKKITNPLTLELAKIVCDTSYFGWLINYAQISNMIAKENNVDYDEMWSFADEIHKFLGNRPKMFPGFIGGHCIIQNLKLIDKEDLRQIDKINNLYAKKVKNAKSIAKKYVKGRQSYDKV